MKKIDLHIHTVKTPSDADFTFDIHVLRRYVDEAGLDAIALTNHNRFDRTNYDLTSSSLSVPVFPGVELNVATAGTFGHVLVIAPRDDVDIFQDGVLLLESRLPDENSFVEWEEVVSSFACISRCLVIPHYKKKKSIDSSTLEAIRRTTGIDALEVKSAKTWLAIDDAPENLVLFSDSRPGAFPLRPGREASESRFSYGFTYLDCDEMSVGAIKRALKTKGSTSVFGENREFEILPIGLPVSRKLNVLLGARSSGKTFTLKRILDAYREEDCAYIGQFEITKDAEDERFDKLISEEDARFEREYLSPLQKSIDDYCATDMSVEEAACGKYLEALFKYASSPVDSASSCPIYSAEAFVNDALDATMEEDASLRSAIRVLLQSKEREGLIESHVGMQNLRELDQAIGALMLESHLEKSYRDRASALTRTIQQAISRYSARKPLPSSSCIRDYFRAAYAEERLASVLDRLCLPESLKDVEEGKYRKVRRRAMWGGAKESRAGIGRKLPRDTDVAGLFAKGSDGLSRLKTIRAMDPEAQACSSRLLLRVESEVVTNDEDATPLSGGQRAEYLFLHKLAGATGKEVVLIDEPESSFDNPFLNNHINAMLRELAEESTVFVVTHNNTLGVSLEPNCVIYASHEPGGAYRIYSGMLSSGHLRTVDGHELPLRDVLLETMEAGEAAYQARRGRYEAT